MRLPTYNTVIGAALLVASACTVLQAEEAGTADIDFLDYLGHMVEEDGEWLDLMALESIEDSYVDETPEKSDDQEDKQ